jgi:hypothetical protein
MWEAARTRARERALRRRKLGAVAGVAGALLLLSTLILPASRAPTPDLEEIAALSARLEPRVVLVGLGWRVASDSLRPKSW